MKTALITGVCGQDGAYLADLLLQRGYRVCGTHRLARPTATWRLENLGLLNHPAFQLHPCDLTDLSGCRALVEATQPDEFYNLASQSSVGLSLRDPFTTTQIAGVAVLNMLEAIRIIKPAVRFFQASSADMFGRTMEVPQSENTPFRPGSPYAIAKLYAHWLAVHYREAYGIFTACGILFNHESPLRGMEFVTRKISHGVARIAAGQDAPLLLGNLDVARDWGYAVDFVEGMYRMLQQVQPDDFVLATSRSATVREFVQMAFSAAGIELEWRGAGLEEHALDRKTKRILVRVDKQFYRPCESSTLRGDVSKARKLLGWHAQTSLEQLCRLMVGEDQHRLKLNLPY